MSGFKPQIALVALALLITYGSLYPFHYAVPVSFQASFKAFAFEGSWWTSIGDEIGNLVLFMPLGAAAALSLPIGRSSLAATGLFVLASVALSLIIQIMQIYFPPREAALADVLSNFVGALIGMSGGLAVRRTMQVRLPHLEKDAWVVLLILAAWLLGNLWPFVPSINFQGWKDSVKPLFIAPQWNWSSFLFHLGAVYFVGELLGSMMSPRTSERFVLLLIAAVFVGKLVVVGQSMQPAFVLGTVVALLTARFFRRLNGRRPLWLFGMLFTTYTLRSLLPFQLRDVPSPISWMPFASLLDGAMDTNVMNLANSIYFFVGMSWLVARLHGRVVGIAVALAMWATMIELIQCWLVGRTPDVTPPILAFAAGLMVRLAGLRTESPGLRTSNPVSTSSGIAKVTSSL